MFVALSRRFLREPLVWFMAVAMALFALQSRQTQSTAEAGDAISLLHADLDAQRQQAETRLGRALTRQERNALANAEIERELLLREAQRLGLYDDPQIEAMVIEKLRFALAEPLTEPPTEADLRRFHAEHRDTYRVAETFDYEAVLFPDPGAVPSGTLERLATGDMPVPEAGAPAIARDDGARASADALAVSFGPAIRDLLNDWRPGQWRGPLATGRNVAFVRLTARHASRELAFEEVREVVRVDFERARQGEAFARWLEGLRAKATVTFEGRTLRRVGGAFALP